MVSLGMILVCLFILQNHGLENENNEFVNL